MSPATPSSLWSGDWADGKNDRPDSLRAMNRTFIICKPDAVERGLVGQILARFETKGFSIVAAELRTLDADTLARHYEEHVGKGFYDDLVAFMSRGPAVVAVLEGPEGTWETVREMMGATNPMKSAPGTIRGISAPSSPRT